MTRCPFAEWAPWKYVSPNGQPTYYRDLNRPVAAVLHIMQGHLSTAREWARDGHFGASWHYSVGRDGTILQHLEHRDGGYHAGIAVFKAEQYPPRWALFKGAAINVNTYTIGIEHEGFAGQPWTDAQRASSKRLVHWLAELYGWPLDVAHFPPHADIDLRDRPDDFDTPPNRAAYYQFLFAQEEDEMTPQERARLERVERLVAGNGMKRATDGAVLVGEDALREAEKLGLSLAASIQGLNDALTRHIDSPHAAVDVLTKIAEALDAARDKLEE